MVNTVVLVGRLCAVPESKQTTNGTTLCNFRIAVNRRNKQDEADFFNCICFEKTATFVQQYVDKGALVGVEGRLQSRTYQTQGGETRYVVEVIANSVQALESKQEADRRRAASGAPAPAGTQQTPAQTQQQASVPPVAQRVGSAPSAPQTSVAMDEDDPFGD